MDATKTLADVDALAELITRACGPRSLSEFSRACGISPAQLSRVKSGICRPSKKLCFKMASEHYAKEMGLSSDEFLKAAGYNPDEIEGTKDFEQVASLQNETIALGIISKYLMERGGTYQLLPMGENREVDFAFLVSNDSTKVRWEFVTNFSQVRFDTSVRMSAYYYNLGRLLSFKPKVDVQYTVLMDDEALFDQVTTGVNQNQVLANVSVALIDFSKMMIRKEVIWGRNSEYLKLSAYKN